MKAEIVQCTDPRSIPLALTVLKRGGLIAFPTDTVYGVAALASYVPGIDNLFVAKGRDNTKAIAVLIGHLNQLDQVALELNEAASRLIARFWPGALTVVVQRHPDLPSILSPLPTIGVRMPDYAYTLNLINQSGPLATTSANLSGQPDALTAVDALEQLGSRIDLILDGGAAPGAVPSTVVDCTASQPIILRQGAISEARMNECLEYLGIVCSRKA